MSLKPLVLLETVRSDKDNRSSYLFQNPVKIIEFKAKDNIQDFFFKIDRYRKRGFWLAGYFAYEFGYFLEPVFKPLRKKYPFPLAYFLVCEQPVTKIIDNRLKTIGPDYKIENIKPNINKAEYTNNIKKIKKYLEQGKTYQVNYTFKLKSKFEGNTFGIYQELKKRQPTAYTAYLSDGKRDILSFSPELFFRCIGQEITVKPMKGTLDLNLNPNDLCSDLKTRAENIMIVDLLRNDLGRICRKGTIKANKLFKIEKHPTLFQMTSTIKGKLKKGINSKAIIEAIFPCGSVTGAPKIETMRLIAGLEKEPRDVYCGAIGYFSPDNTVCFNVAIRTVVINKTQAELGVGGGIVYDSLSNKEYKEALLKAEFLTKAREFSLIETMLYKPTQGIWLINLHLKRLTKSAKNFSIKFDKTQLKQRLIQAVKGRNKECKISLLLDQQGQISITLGQSDSWPKKLKIKISKYRLNHNNQFLYHKTTKRDLYNQEFKAAKILGFAEVIFLNNRAQVCEGAISNIFVEIGHKLYTPVLNCGLLPGTLRQELLDSKKAQEKVLYLKDLKAADKIFVGNSVRGLKQAEIERL